MIFITTGDPVEGTVAISDGEPTFTPSVSL